MLWWMWIVLWTVLVLVSLAFIVGAVWGLVTKKALPALREVEAFADDFTVRWNAAAQGASQPLRTPAEPAVFTPVNSARAAYSSGRDQRHTARLIRRMNRKDAKGQPQRLSDLRRAERKGLHHGPLV